jgi:hypothetical protein
MEWRAYEAETKPACAAAGSATGSPTVRALAKVVGKQPAAMATPAEITACERERISGNGCAAQRNGGDDDDLVQSDLLHFDFLSIGYDRVLRDRSIRPAFTRATG